MMRKIMLILMTLILMGAETPLFQATLDNQNVSLSSTYEENKIVMVSLEEISKLLNIKSVIKQENITLNYQKTSAFCTLNKKEAKIKSKAYYLQLPPVMRHQKIYVPLLFIADLTGYKMDWDLKKKTLHIFSKKFICAFLSRKPKRLYPEKSYGKSHGRFKAFCWEPGVTKLGKKLFLKNMRVENENLIFEMPELKNVKCTYWGERYDNKFEPGKTYSFSLKEKKGYIAIHLEHPCYEFPENSTLESYIIYLDFDHPVLKGDFANEKGEVIITHSFVVESTSYRTAGTLKEVQQAAEELENE